MTYEIQRSTVADWSSDLESSRSDWRISFQGDWAMKKNNEVAAIATAIALGGMTLPRLVFREAIDPRVKCIKRNTEPRPDGQATPEEQSITTGPKRGKGTRRQRKNRK